MLDRRLLYVERYIELQELELDKKIEDYLNVSERQSSRLLAKWVKEGWIEYKGGIGRGNKIMLKANIDIEKELFLQAVNNINHMSMSEIKEYLKLPWQENSREKIQQVLKNNFEFRNNEDPLSFMDYVQYIPQRIHPLYIVDSTGQQVIYQTCCCLYQLDENYELIYELVRYDYWEKSNLHLFLKKDCKFSDGTTVTSEDVKYAIDKVRNDEKYKALFKEIIEIEIINKFHLVIKSKSKKEVLKFLLSEPYTAIYKENNKDVLGSGPYFVESHFEDLIILRKNPHYKRYIQIERVYLFKNSKKNQEYLSSNLNFLKQQEIYIKNELLLFNPNKRDLSIQQRKEIKNVLLNVAYNNINFNDSKNCWLEEEPTSIKFSEEYKRPLRILCDEYSVDFVKKAQQIFSTGNIRCELEIVSYAEYVSTSLKEYNVDLVWISESFQQRQPYYLFNLLTHCKFKDWYQQDENHHFFIEEMEKGNIVKAVFLAEQYLKKLIELYLFSNVLYRNRVFSIPEHYINIKINHYGSVNYAKILYSTEND